MGLTAIKENRLNRKLKELEKNGEITNALYNKLRPTGSQPPRIYGLPKIHKPDIPLRPIGPVPARLPDNWPPVLSPSVASDPLMEPGRSTGLPPCLHIVRRNILFKAMTNSHDQIALHFLQGLQFNKYSNLKSYPRVLHIWSTRQCSSQRPL